MNVIKYTQIKDVFAEIGIDIYEFNIETDEDISTPFVVYTATDGNFFEADGINYLKTLSVAVAVIDETMNFPMQRKIEDMFDKYFIIYDKQINFDNDVRLYSISYSFEVLDDEFN